MMRLIRGVLCGMCLMLAACATQAQVVVGEGFERSVKAYNRMLRWREIENAGVTYIEQEQLDAYLKQAANLKSRGISVTDFRIISSRYIPEKQIGDAVAEFDYYILPSNRVKTVSYRQEWVYLEPIKSWKLKSGLPLFE